MSSLHKSIFKLKQNFFCSDKDATGNNYLYYKLDDIYLDIRKIIKKLNLDLDFSFISNIVDNKQTLSLVFYSSNEEKIVSTQFLSTFNDILLNDTEMLKIKTEKATNLKDVKSISYAINSPHNFGSIRTYTKKYMLLDFFCILDATDDDARSWNKELEELEKRKEIDLKNEIKDILDKEKNLQTAENINQYLAKNYSKHYNNGNWLGILEDLNNEKSIRS
jgi:hypothetical protein